VHHSETLPAASVENNYFITNSQVYNYSNKDDNDLHVLNCYTGTNFGSTDTKFKAARLWNELPQFLKDPSHILSFKKVYIYRHFKII
jgi:hypothetical protein